MNAKGLKLYEALKSKGLTADQEEKILAELHDDGLHDIPNALTGETHAVADIFSPSPDNLYAYHDLHVLQSVTAPRGSYTTCLRSIDELLERDKQREKDGFPRKIRVGRLIKPGKGGKDKVVVVPATVEEKFIHDKFI